MLVVESYFITFQHTAARRRLPSSLPLNGARACFNTQPPEGGCEICKHETYMGKSFNTQPPEGGCRIRRKEATMSEGFNTQPPEGGCYNLI